MRSFLAVCGVMTLAAQISCVFADDVLWPGWNLTDLSQTLSAQPIPPAGDEPVAVPTRAAPTPQPSYLHMCRAGARRSTWHWAQSDARAQVCDGRSCCPHLECWQARWTGFTPDCDRGQCTKVPANTCSQASVEEPPAGNGLPVVWVKGGGISTQQSIYKCPGGRWSWSGGPGCVQWIWSSPSCRGASPCPLRGH